VRLESSGAGEPKSCVLRGLERGLERELCAWGLRSCVRLESSGAGESCVLGAGAGDDNPGIGTCSQCHSFPSDGQQRWLSGRAAKETCPGRIRALGRCLLALGLTQGLKHTKWTPNTARSMFKIGSLQCLWPFKIYLSQKNYI
jgi:hypothetical protein